MNHKWAKRVIHRKQHKLAIDEYLMRQRKALDSKLEQIHRKIQARSVLICLQSLPRDRSIVGIRVAGSNIPVARVQERVELLKLTLNEALGEPKKIRQVLAKGTVVEVSSAGLKIKLDKALLIDDSVVKIGDASVEMRIEFSKEPINRCRRATEWAQYRFKQAACELSLHKLILGHYKDENNIYASRCVRIHDFERLNRQQLRAVKQCMMKKISLIEGPAGSGKTKLAASLAFLLNKFEGRRVLLCSPIQSSLDKIASLLSKLRANSVVKLPETFGNAERAKMESLNDKAEYSLDIKVRHAILLSCWKKLSGSIVRNSSIEQQQRMVYELSSKLIANCSAYLRRKMELKVLSEADFVCCTLEQVGLATMRDVHFDFLIIDDAHMTTELDCLVALMAKGLKQVTLIGEMRYAIRLAKSIRTDSYLPEKMALPSKFNDHIKVNGQGKEASDISAKNIWLDDYSFADSLFERWLSMGLTAMALEVQCRMHEIVAVYPNHHFYQNRMKNDHKINESRTSEIHHHLTTLQLEPIWLPKKDCPIAIFTTSDQNNSVNAKVGDLVNKLIWTKEVGSSAIGVITNNPDDIFQNYSTDVEVATVDQFVGREKDFIILVCHDMPAIDKHRRIDLLPMIGDGNFVKNDIALNIAITRARLGLFIVADSKNCGCPPLIDMDYKDRDIQLDIQLGRAWKCMVAYYHKNGLIASS